MNSLDNQLIDAAREGNLNKIKQLEAQGADIHANNDWALRYSANCGYLDVVKYLVDKGADIHANNDFALQLSAGYGHLDVVKYLVDKGADVHADDDCALRWSGMNGHLDVHNYLKSLYNVDTITNNSCEIEQPINNQGRDNCFWCGEKTVKIQGFMSEYDYCKKCEK